MRFKVWRTTKKHNIISFLTVVLCPAFSNHQKEHPRLSLPSYLHPIQGEYITMVFRYSTMVSSIAVWLVNRYHNIVKSPKEMHQSELFFNLRLKCFWFVFSCHPIEYWWSYATNHICIMFPLRITLHFEPI